MRLIDADYFIERLDACDTLNGIGLEPVMAIRDVKALVSVMPTIDAAPVVHARWVEPVPGDGFPYCGNCKAPALDKGLFLNPKLMDWYKTKYCPNCGAKMDLEEPQCTSTDTEH
jgi:hypothetical protein